MNLFGFSSLSAAALFTLIVPLVVLYFLKLKRPRLEIPSLLLWQRVIQDHRVNSPLQRFKRNLLLLLQLLLLIFLVLAAMQPFWRTDPYNTQYLPIILDTSASMSAVRHHGGPSRLDDAKTMVRDMIDDLEGHQKIALIACSSNARRAAPFTNNRRELLDALEKIKVDHLDSDLTQAFRMADAMAHLEPFERALLLSDGNIPDVVDFDLPFKIAYERLDSAGDNLGIGALNARRNPSGQWNVFVRLFASTEQPLTGTLLLVYNGQIHAEEDVVVSAQRTPRLVFNVPGREHASIELRLVPDGFDAMACDNTAYLELTPLRPLRAAVDPSLPAFSHAMQSVDHVDVVSFAKATSAGHSLDLLVLGPDADTPAQAHVTLHAGTIPDDLATVITTRAEPTLVVDWLRDASLLDHVNFSGLRIWNAPQYLPEKDASDLENLHYEVLVYGQLGPLMLRRKDGLVIDYHMLFHNDQSTLPYRVGFPVMVSNLVRTAMRSAGLLEVAAARTHVLPSITLHPGVTYQVHGPDGYRRKAEADPQGTVAGIPAPRVGRYVITKGDENRVNLGISLLSPFESQLTTVDKIAFNEMTVDVASHQSRINKPLWPLFTTLGVLLLEWWFFNHPGRVSVTR